MFIRGWEAVGLCHITEDHSAVESQKAVTAYFESKQLLHFDYAEQYNTQQTEGVESMLV